MGRPPFGEVTAADAAALAGALLEIAELAMPATYFATDSRCQLARAVLADWERMRDRTDTQASEDTDASRDVGYVTGLHAAARWLALFDQDLPRFDRDTCRRLAAGLTAMTLSAVERLGVNPDGTEARDWPAAEVKARHTDG